VRRRDELDAPAGNRSGNLSVGSEPQLIHDDRFRPVIDDSLEDDSRLLGAGVRSADLGQRDLEPPGAPDRGMRNLPIPANLVARVDDDDASVKLIGQDGGHSAKHGRLPGPRPPHDQDVLAGFEEIAERLGCARDGAPYAEGEADDFIIPVTDTCDPVKSSIDTSSIILSEPRDPAKHVLQVLPAHFSREHHGLIVILKMETWWSTQIQLDLFKRFNAPPFDRGHHPPWDNG
jgi:hypothetical protein